MAIIVEQERSRSGILTFVIWGVILVIIVVAVYYVFFRKPETINVAPPASFANTQELAKIHFNPQDLIGNPAFQALKTYITLPQASTTGRVNPFLSF